MKLKIQLRLAAIALLRGALKIAPSTAAEWGHAMLAELHHIEGDWSALAWSIGSAGVLAKHALLAAVIPGASNQVAPSEGNFFAKEKPMRKRTAIAAAICIAASLLFFAVPTFREAFQLSLTQWRGLARSLRTGYVSFETGPDYLQIAQLAEKSHDAQGLAFAAIHRSPTPKAAEWADEAVKEDPQLTWIYAIVGRGGQYRSEIGDWISKLEEFDPQNGVPHLMQAQEAEMRWNAAHGYALGGYTAGSDWQSAMSAAFHSPEVDTYGDRVDRLNRAVALRYGIYDPYQAATGYFLMSGSMPAFGSAVSYDKVLLNAGDALAARGDSSGAERQYKLAAHFGEMVQASGRIGTNRGRATFTAAYADILLHDPYGRLADFYERQGDQVRGARFRTLLADADSEKQQSARIFRTSLTESPASIRNAYVVGVSGIAFFACIIVASLCTIITIANSGAVRLSKLRAGLFTRAIAATSFAGLLISSAALYLSYRPYAEIIRAYLSSGDPSHLPAVIAFLSHLDYSQTAPRHGGFFSLWTFPMYFYAGVIALCAIGLLFATTRFLWQRRRALAA
jgi:hypothetical protein